GSLLPHVSRGRLHALLPPPAIPHARDGGASLERRLRPRDGVRRDRRRARARAGRGERVVLRGRIDRARGRRLHGPPPLAAGGGRGVGGGGGGDGGGARGDRIRPHARCPGLPRGRARGERGDDGRAPAGGCPGDRDARVGLLRGGAAVRVTRCERGDPTTAVTATSLLELPLLAGLSMAAAG